MTETADGFQPSSFDDYIGQEALKRELQVRIQSAIKRAKPLGHILLWGVPGSGKTSLATVIANELGEPVEELVMPVKQKTLHDIVGNHAGILFLDEIHRAAPSIQEDLLPLLRPGGTGYIQLPNGRRIEAPWLTVIGATTKLQKVDDALLDRFWVPDIDPYTNNDMARIILGMCRKADVVMPKKVAFELGVAANGRPRRALQFVLRYRDEVVVHGTHPTADDLLILCRTSDDGLEVVHERYMTLLDALGGTAGLRPIANLLQLSDTVVTDIERLLVEKRFVTFSGQGRTLTRGGYTRLRKMQEAG